MDVLVAPSPGAERKCAPVRIRSKIREQKKGRQERLLEEKRTIARMRKMNKEFEKGGRK
jgi:hypothetical protein